MPAITLGHGVKRPQGQRHYLRGDLVESIGHAIAGHLGQESWWSPHTWKWNKREGNNWEASVAAVVDIDCENHGVLDMEVGAKVLKRLGGVANLVHLTPHGVRAVFVFDHRVPDRRLFEQAAIGAAALALAAIKEADADCLEIDSGPTADVARLFFTPNATVVCRHGHGECTDPVRRADVLIVRDAQWPATELSKVCGASGPTGGSSEPSSGGSVGAVQVASALLELGYQEKGKDIYFRCPLPGHTDENPSARFNTKKGVWHCDVCRKGGGWKKLAKLLGLEVSRGRAGNRQTQGPPPSPKTDGRLRIVYRTSMGDEPLHMIVPIAVTEIARKCAHSVYTRGGYLVRATSEPPSPSKKLDRGSGIRIGQIPDGALREIVGAAVQWAAERENRKGETYEVETWTPVAVLRAVRDRGQWDGIRPLTGVIEAPTVRPDGSLIVESGYDAATGLLYVPHCSYPPIPDRPTEGEVSEAFDTLLSPFREFPFQTEIDRASVVALMLTIAARSWICGCVPHWVVLAPTFGAGKSLLLLAATKAMTGITPDFMAPVGGRESDAEAEMRKRLTTLLMEAPRVCVIDNLPDGATFESKAFAALLTSTRWKDRILGKSESVSLPHDIVWTSTGCNVALWGDLARRSLSILIDPQVEDPHLRAFETQDLPKLVSDEHPSLLCAALTVVRGFIAAGMPGHGHVPLGMFEAWDSRIRAAVIWATGLRGTPLDPLDSAARLQKDAPDRLALTELLAAWHELLPEEPPVTAREIVALCVSQERLRDAVIGLGARKKGELDARVLGNRLRTLAGQVRGGLLLQKFDVLQGTARWQVTRPADRGTRGSRGTGAVPPALPIAPSRAGENQDEPHQPHESHGSHCAPIDGEGAGGGAQ